MNNTSRSTRIRWWIAGLMWLAIAINYIDRTVLSAAAPHLIKELDINPEMMGFIMAAFFWSYALLQIPAGWFADRFGQKKVSVLRWPGGQLLPWLWGWQPALNHCWRCV